MIDQETKDKLDRARKPIETANKFRLAFLFIAVVGLVFIFFGNKIWEGAGWYTAAVSRLYTILFWDLAFVFLTTILKLFYTVRYNKIVKNIGP